MFLTADVACLIWGEVLLPWLNWSDTYSLSQVLRPGQCVGVDVVGHAWVHPRHRQEGVLAEMLWSASVPEVCCGGVVLPTAGTCLLLPVRP
jgi:hypothetical protein